MKPEREWIEPGRGRSVLVKRFGFDRFDVAWHHHPEVELTRIDAGAGRCMIGSGVSRFGPGQLVLLGPNLPHAWFSEDGEAAPDHGGPPACRASVAQFDAERIGAAAAAFFEAAGLAALLRSAAGGLLFGPGTAGAEIDRLMAAAEDSALVPGRLLEALAVLASAPSEPLGTAAAVCAGDPAVEAMTRLLQERFREGVTLAELAAAAHLSESAAARRFAAAMGQNVTGYRHRLRVQAAESLMLSGDAGLAEVALRSGFPSLALFHRVFKRLHRGETPAAWRRRARGMAGGSPA